VTGTKGPLAAGAEGPSRVRGLGRDFFRLYATRLAGQLADGIVTVALTSYVFFSPERQTTAAAAAGAFAVLLLPYSIVGPFAGVLLDRWRRRQVLVLANTLRALLVVGVAALVAAGIPGAPFYLAGLAVLSVNRFVLAALSAALPHVVKPRDLVVANSVSTTSGAVVAGLGGGIGFLVRSLAGEGDEVNAGILLLGTAGYGCSALLATRMSRELLGPDLAGERPETREAVRHVVRGLVAGARHVGTHRAAAYALGAIGVHRFFYGVSTISTILLYRNYFNEPSETTAAIGGLGLAVIASIAGFLVAAVITPAATRRLGVQAWVVALFGFAAVVEAVFAVALSEALLVAGAFLVGLVAQGAKICVDTIVQESVDDAFRGRVFSFYDTLFNVTFVTAAAFAALAMPMDGYSPAIYALIAAGYAGTGVAYFLGGRGATAPAAP
jgi:MFS family permease